mgnify:CR=1 FL=1
MPIAASPPASSTHESRCRQRGTSRIAAGISAPSTTSTSQNVPVYGVLLLSRSSASARAGRWL